MKPRCVPLIGEFEFCIECDKVVHFDVPVKDMGETPFDSSIPAQLLIRWIA